jgi:hypothetical protein
MALVERKVKGRQNLPVLPMSEEGIPYF